VATILLVCTGNICRSPMAEGFFRRQLAERGIDGVHVESAGVSGWEGSPATAEAVQALDELHVDIAEHRARRLTRRMVEAADLVVAMAGEHRDAIGRVVPSAASRTFTMKELVRLLDAEGDPGESAPPDARIRARTESADGRRALADGSFEDEDVADPLGLGLEAYRATAWELEELSARVVAGLLGIETQIESKRDDRGGGASATEGGAA
jgi:protein-tyrosine phosphatase